MQDEGHLEWIGNWERVRHRRPKALATKLAVLVDDEPDGSKKVRFIVDMLRSGINGLTKMKERIILPGVLDLWEGNRVADFEVEMLVIDIVDAFLNSRTQEEERAYAIVTDEEHYYAYRGVPFGLASAPLLWGRVAAWLGRSAQAVSKPSGLAMQIYVDDPIPTAAGSKKTRTRALAKVILFW